jgi:hypothetical protein
VDAEPRNTTGTPVKFREFETAEGSKLLRLNTDSAAVVGTQVWSNGKLVEIVKEI